MRTPEHVEQVDQVTRLLREYDQAVADEQDAASRAASAAQDLEDLGVDVETATR